MSTGHEAEVDVLVCELCGSVIRADHCPACQDDEWTTYQSTWFSERMRELPARIIAVGAAAAIALILASPAHATPPTFELPVHPPDAYLAGCDIMVHDDGSRLAECPEDGAVLLYDVDGQRFVNEAGAPIRASGWYVLE